MRLDHGEPLKTMERAPNAVKDGQWPVSVLVNTYNAAAFLDACLRSVDWAEEIVVVDMHSRDETRAIAARHAAKIILHPPCGYADPARAEGIRQCSKPWILIIDADEVCPPALTARLKRVIERDEADVVSIPHNNYFFGRMMRGCRWGPLQDRHDRFFKREAVIITPHVHHYLHRRPGVRCLVLTDPREGFVHFNYLDWEHFLDKFNRYTTIEAENIYDGLKSPFGVWGASRRSLKEFIGRFLKHRGYHDGLQGFVLCVLMALYPWVVMVKYRLMKRHHTKKAGWAIRARYENTAREIADG